MLLRILFALAMIVCCVLGCNDPSPISPLPFQDDIEKVNGETARMAARAVVLQNPLGGLIITGSNAREELRWALTKTISKRGGFVDASKFSSIALQTSMRNDTLFLEIISPPNTEDIKYQCGLALVLPANMACHIASANGLINVSHLDTTLTIFNAKYDMSVLSHNGSCEITALQGNVSLMLALPDSGFCFVKTGQGNLNIQIPVATSAQLTAGTLYGSVTFSGLNFSQIEEQSPKALRATLGDGLGRLQLDTEKGEIFISGL